jgi:hypothetical protein
MKLIFTNKDTKLLDIKEPIVKSLENSSTNIIEYNDYNIIDFIIKNDIKIISNVYQSKYKNGNATGIGDFIRGTYFLLDFCENYNIQPKVIFNNIVSKFLINSNNDKDEYNLKNINLFKNFNEKKQNIKNNSVLYPTLDNENIIKDFVEYLKISHINNGNILIYSISYPNVIINEKNKFFIKNMLEPTDEIKNSINNYLKTLNLNYKQYSVFHIRSGDNFLIKNNKNFSKRYLYKVKEIIQNTIMNDLIYKTNERPKYLIISDNNEIKLLLKKYFPQLKILITEITHLGEGINLKEIKVKNTLMDFYLLSLANKIVSITSNLHGSGFSYWCARTYDIPYTCKYVRNK